MVSFYASLIGLICLLLQTDYCTSFYRSCQIHTRYQHQLSSVVERKPAVVEKTAAERSAELATYDEMTNNFLSASEASGFLIRLLELKDVNRATQLVVDSHFEAPFVNDNIDTGSIKSNIVNPIMNFVNNHLRNELAKQVMDGLLVRARNRLRYPSVSKSSESMIVAAYNDKNKIVGVIEVYPTKEAYICNLSVSSEVRRRGLGRFLCTLTEDLVKSHWGTNKVTLQVEQSNIRAKRLYESMDYEIGAVKMASLYGYESIIGKKRPLINYSKQL
jgi:ribosomal protein S18 acetylase RimI-like enzyme